MSTPEIPPPSKLIARKVRVPKHRDFKTMPEEEGLRGVLASYWNEAVKRGRGEAAAVAREEGTVRPGKK